MVKMVQFHQNSSILDTEMIKQFYNHTFFLANILVFKNVTLYGTLCTYILQYMLTHPNNTPERNKNIPVCSME